MSFTHPEFEDHSNPYAAPKAEVGPTPVEYEPVAATPPTIGGILSRTYELFRRRMGLCMLVALGWWVMNVGIQMMMQLAGDAIDIQDRVAKAGVLLSIAFFSIILQTWLNVGQMIVLVKVARDRPTAFGEIFNGGRYLLRAIVASILFGLGVVIMILVVAVPVALVGIRGNQQYAAAVLVLIGVSLAVYCIIRLGQFLYAIIDQDAGILESFGVSFQITQERVLTLIAIGILVFLVNVCGLVACLVGALFTFPFTMLLLSVTYVSFADAARLKPGNAAPKRIESDFDGIL